MVIVVSAILVGRFGQETSWRLYWIPCLVQSSCWGLTTNRLDSSQWCGVYFADRGATLQQENEPISISNEDEQTRSEPRGFTKEELVGCESCMRLNPPTRTSCLYCGAALPITAVSSVQVKPTLRPLETWEQGFNVILLPGDQACSDLTVKKISALVKLDAADVRELVMSGVALPLARCVVQEEAALVETRLSELGIKVLIVADQELDVDPPTRVRTIDLTDDSLVVFPTGREGVQSIPWRDITLMVVGRRIVRRLEVAERQTKRSGKEVVDSRELSTDAERLDIYSKRAEQPWRVAADNFDFSCLREMKTLLVAKNFRSLIEELRKRAEFANFDDSYLRLRKLLSLVWSLEQRTESLGLRKPRMGRINTAVVTTSDNEMQFTRYSRLLHVLKLRGAGLKA